MAIRIPSAKTYNRQNPKVRDNVVERIEVGAVEVVPNNEYETPVYNSQQIVDKSAMKAMSTIQRNTVGNVISYSGMGSGFSCNIASIEVFDIKTIHLSISIKKIQKNSLVSKIYYEKDNEGNNQIKYSIFGKTNKGTCSQSITWSQPSGVWVGEGEATFSNYGKISFTEDTIGQEENRIDLYSTFSYTKEKEYSNSAVTSNFTPQDVSNVTSFVELEDMYLIDIDFVVSMKVAKLGGFGDTITNGGYNTTLTGTYEEYIPTEIEITVYGNTIGIDLTDKTVYINGEAQKKVHSVEGNELMQTSNYLLDSGAKAIETMYGATQKEYERGKETATIRCSIGDYYDYKSGEKVISADFIIKDTFHDEYQEVEYIESTGTQYIDTGFIPNQDTRVTMSGYLMPRASQVLSFPNFFGSRTNGTNDFAVGMRKAEGNRGMFFRYGKQQIDNIAGLYGAVTLDGDFEIDCDKHRWSMSFANGNSGSNTFNYVVFDTGKNAYLFGSNNGTDNAFIVMRLYACKIYDNGNLVRDFIPVYRKSDGAIGLYDLVGKSFYANAGTGTFLKGADTEVEVEPTGKALKMSFEIGDEVIPMVYGADGKDYPMSTYKNGSPKVFVVRGSKIFYDGAIFQEIFLQERLTN